MKSLLFSVVLALASIVIYAQDPSSNCQGNLDTFFIDNESNMSDVTINSRTNKSNIPYRDFIANAYTNGGEFLIERTYFYFDLSSVKDSIVNAKLILYGNPKPANPQGHDTLSGSNAAHIYRVTSSWSDQGISWANQPTHTISDAVKINKIGNDSAGVRLDFTELARAFQKYPNGRHGYVFKLDTEEKYRTMVFAASNHPDSTLAPRLIVCHSTTVSLSKKNVLFSLYPNPAQGTFTIESSEKGRLYIYDLKGQLIRELWLPKGQKAVNLVKQKGVYLLHYKGESGTTVQKLILE